MVCEQCCFIYILPRVRESRGRVLSTARVLPTARVVFKMDMLAAIATDYHDSWALGPVDKESVVRRRRNSRSITCVVRHASLIGSVHR